MAQVCIGDTGGAQRACLREGRSRNWISDAERCGLKLMVRRRARKAVRLARAQVRGGALILVYHRISPPDETPGRDPFRLCVGPGSFAEQIASLADLGTVVPLSVLSGRLRRGGSVKGLMCVTFDDGYVDNLRLAAPILRQHAVPATFFIVTGKTGQSFWWDRLTGLVYGTRRTLPGGRLRLDELGWSSEVADQSPRSRAMLLTSLYALLKDRDDDQRSRALDDLASQVEMDDQILGRAMTWEEIGELLRDELFEVGGHTLTHPQLAAQAEEVQRAEMAECRDQLSEFTGRPVTSFAYPFGARQDVSKLTTEIARQVGYEVACGTELDVVNAASNPLRLPRFWASDWGAEQFSSRVRRWFRP